MSDVRHGFEVADDEIISTALLFVALTGVFASVGYYFIIELGLKRFYMTTLMWSPAVATLVTCKIKGISMKNFAWRFAPAKWMWASYLVPFIYGLVAYTIIWVVGYADVIDPAYVHKVGDFLGLSGWSDTSVIIFSFFMLAGVGIFWRLGTVFGEELGWRGFLTPLLLQKFSFPVVSTFVGLVWSLWYWPIMLETSYNAGPNNIEIQILNITLLTVGMSFIMTYFYVKTQSIWPAVLMHSAHNAFILNVLDPMTLKFEESWKYTGQFGFILPMTVFLMGLFFWFLYKREIEKNA